MISDFKEYLKFLINKKLTPNQFAICWIIETKDIDGLLEYQKEVGAFKASEYNYLIDNGYLENFNEGGKFNLANLIITPKFSEEVFIDEDVAFEQILSVYPKKFLLDGKEWSLLNANLNQLEIEYGKIIKRNKYKHEEILEKTKIMTNKMKRGLINYRGIGKYILGRNWLELEMGDDGGSKDTFTSL